MEKVHKAWYQELENKGWGYSCCVSSLLLPKHFNHSLSLWLHTPPPLWHVRLHHSSGFTWLPVQSITHRLETQLAGKRTWQAELISGAFSSPVVYLEEVSLNCSPEDYGNKLCKMESWTDPIREGRAKRKRLFRKGMKYNTCMQSYM